MVAVVAMGWLIAIWIVVILLSIFFSQNLGRSNMESKTDLLEVHMAVKEEMNRCLVRIPEEQRHGIISGSISRMTLANLRPHQQKPLLVEVRGVDCGFKKKYPAHCGPVEDFEKSIFMDEDTRISFGVDRLDKRSFTIAA